MTFDPMTAALFAARLIQFASALVLLGAALFPVYAGDLLLSPDGLREAFDRWLWRTLLCAAVLSLLSSVAWLLVQSAIIGDGWSSALAGETLSTVLLETEFGRLWIGRLALAGLLTFAVLVVYRRRRMTTGPLLV